jgi:5-methylthioribose kinase
MKFVEPPNQILRKAFIQGLHITTFARDLAQFLSRTLFFSSGLSMDGGELRTRISFWSRNSAMCALTEKVIFTDPYMVESLNHWTSPQLDDFAAALRSDAQLKVSVARLKSMFLSKTQALLHADLHSGSVMASEGSTYVIDPEFAFYGPMGFDVGALLSNLLLAFFSHAANQGRAFADFLLSQIVVFYESFETMFLDLWASSYADSGTKNELYPTALFEGDALVQAQNSFMREVWYDSLGFTGAKMIRRIVGIAHVADLESIADHNQRACCEKRCLTLGRQLVLASNPNNGDLRSRFSNIRDLVNVASELFDSEIAVWSLDN